MAPLASDALSFDGIRLVDQPWFPYLCTENENWRWETTIQGHFNLWVVLGGDGFLTVDGSLYRLVAGMVFVFIPGQKISGSSHSGPPLRRFAAHFVPMRNGSPFMDPPEFPPMRRASFAVDRLVEFAGSDMRAVYQKSEGPGSAAFHVFEFLAEVLSPGILLAPQETAMTPPIAAAVRWVQEHPGERQSTAELAERCGMSRSNFDREFVRQVGLPPARFQQQARLREAKRLLASSSLRVGEVAELLGNTDIYFFSRQFKQHFGRSPKEWRRGGDASRSLPATRES